MNEKKYRDYEYEVYLVDVVFYALRHWRQLVIALVLGGVLGAAVCALISFRQPAAQPQSVTVEEEKEVTYEEAEVLRLQEALKDLEESYEKAEPVTDDAIASMELAYQYRVKYTNLMDYMESSLMMQLDPNEIYQGTLRYYIYDTESAYLLVNLYNNILSEDTVWDELADASGLDISSKYLYELVTASIGTGGASYTQDSEEYHNPLYALVTYKVVSSDEDSCRAMTDLLAEKVSALSEELKHTYGSFSIAEFPSGVAEISSDAYVAKQNSYITQLNTYRTNYTTIESKFTYAELEYYIDEFLSTLEAADGSTEAWDTILAAKADEEEGLKEDELAKAREKIKTAEKAWATAKASAEEEDGEEQVVTRKGPGIKMCIALGLVLGFVVWAAWYVLHYFLDGKVKTEADLAEVFGLSVIGRMSLGKAAKKKGIDGIIEKLYARFRNRPDTPEYVKCALESFRFSNAVLCGDMDDPEVRDFMANITAGSESLTGCDWCGRTNSSLTKALEADAEILVVSMDKTSRRDLYREVTCCALQGIRMAGCIVVEQ